MRELNPSEINAISGGAAPVASDVRIQDDLPPYKPCTIRIRFLCRP
jgi:hypothetical protein